MVVELLMYAPFAYGKFGLWLFDVFWALENLLQGKTNSGPIMPAAKKKKKITVELEYLILGFHKYKPSLRDSISIYGNRDSISIYGNRVSKTRFL